MSLEDFRKKFTPHNISRIGYHGGCNDGTMAAAIGRKALGEIVQLIPLYKRDTWDVELTEDLVPNTTLMIVDFSYDIDIVDKLLSVCERNGCKLIILDHHITAQENLKNYEFAYFDMDRSGAGLAWDYFFNTERPWIVNAIEARDIWKFERVEGSEEFMKVFSYLVNRNVDTYHNYLNDVSLVEKFKEKVEPSMEVINRLINSYVKRAQIYEDVNGKKFACCQAIDFVSDIGNRLVTTLEVDYSATYYYNEHRKLWFVSLRSTEQGADVSKIATKFGGGGHICASGFSISYDKQILEQLLKK